MTVLLQFVEGCVTICEAVSYGFYQLTWCLLRYVVVLFLVALPLKVCALDKL